MREKTKKIRKIGGRWRWLAALFIVFGVMVPTAMANHIWWGSHDGDFQGTPQNNNYIIHPPADQLPKSGKDGTRLQFIMHKFNNESKAGTTASYIPHQYIVSSTVPKLRFELRGGYWNKSNCSDEAGTGGTCADTGTDREKARDRYDRKDANPAWTVDHTKQEGYVSPFYYEVYQLRNGNPQDGRLLGVINPRDPNVFPTTDNGPENNTNCLFVTNTNAAGPCWRTFEINAPGGSGSAITNRITLNGQAQDSCAKRFAQWPNGCYTRKKISKADSTTRLASEFDETTSLAMHGIFDTLQVGGEQAVPGERRKGIASSIKDFFQAGKAHAFHTGPGTHQITVFVNPRAHSPGKVTVQIFGGACNDNVKTVGPDGSVTFGGCPDGHSFTAAVHESKFEDGPFFPNPPGGASIHCSIGDGAKTQAVGGDNQAHFTYNCTRRILVWANPRSVTGGKVTARIFGGACNDNQKVINSDGYALFVGCPLIGHTYNAVVLEDKFTKFAANGVVYTCVTDGNKNKNVGSDNQVNFFYHCTRHNPIANDGGIINSPWFNQIDPTHNGRFDSSSQPNLNGNYVFLIKQVAYTDIGNGYVTDYESLLLNDQTINGRHYKQGCALPKAGNVVSCPNSLLTAAQKKSNERIVQNGYFLRTPKEVAGPGTRQYVASSPDKWAFNFNHGPAPGGEYEGFKQGHYTGLRFQAGGSTCRNPYKLRIQNADWDKGGIFGADGFDKDIGASVDRLGTADDFGTLHNKQNGSIGVDPVDISSDWKQSTSNHPLVWWVSHVNDPDFPKPSSDYWNPPYSPTYGQGYPVSAKQPLFQPSWQSNERFTGRLQIKNWDSGNNLIVGGMPFTWGYWPTCIKPSITPDSPKPITSGYKYNGKDTFTPTNNNGDAVLDFVFRYNLPETRGQVDYRVEINGGTRGGGTAFNGQGRTAHGAHANLGTHAVRIPVNVNDLRANTTYNWRACVNARPGAGGGEECSGPVPFQINKGPTAQIVSGDPDYNTNTGNVNYNCSRLAAKLTDPEGHQVRPHFTIRWAQDGRTHVVSTLNRGGGTSDTWGRWTSGNGYKASGTTFTSDDVRPATWTVNGTNRGVPNKTLTQFLQNDVPEGATVTWWAMGEDRYGASDILGWPDLNFITTSAPRAVNDSGYPTPNLQLAMNYRRFGPPVSRSFYKKTRPNLLPPGSTKKFYDLNGAETENVTDGQLVRVETKIRNTGETPTKRYEIYDYLGAVRDFEPPITTSSELPITVQYNNGEERAVEPTISRVIPNHQNGFLDRPENLASSGDDRRASYKLDFGTNPDQAENISVTKNGREYENCQGDCRTDPSYPDSVYWLSSQSRQEDADNEGGGSASASYRLGYGSAGTYDLTLNYFNGKTTDTSGAGSTAPLNPPPGYSYRVKVDVVTCTQEEVRGDPGDNEEGTRADGGTRLVTRCAVTDTRTVDLPIESSARSRDVHSYVVEGLNLSAPDQASIRITWTNDYWQPGVYDANFGLHSLRVSTPEEASDSILRPGQLNPGETIALRYYIRANRNRTATSTADQNQNLQRRLEVGDPTGPRAPQPDPKGGTIDIGDAHTFVPYSENYCDRSNPLINHTCEFKPGDVLAPWLRGERGSIASNEGVFGYDPLAGEQNATFLVQANGVLSHFSGGVADLGGYQAAPATCAPPGKIDWRKEMYQNVQRLLARPYNANAQAFLNGANVKNLNPGGPNVWVADGDLRMGRSDGDTRFRGVGTIIVKGDLTIEGNLAYDSGAARIDSLGIIVLGNVDVKDSVGKLVGTYYVSDIRTDLSGTSSGCPFTDTASGRFTSGRSNVQLNVQGVLVARRFEFQRYFLDPSDTVADPAENVYYDGRVVANTPPGFSTFRNTAAWYEIAP